MSKSPPVVIEVFGKPSEYLLNQLGSTRPRVFNGEVMVKRYRVTVEEIPEEKDVLRDRLLVLQREPGHIDKNKCIKAEAKKLGIVL